MAVSSLLNPASIVRERPTTAAAVQNFITGGSPLGQGVVASAANKIVGFQRGAAAVAARPPDLNSIIQTLSSNILNNVENRVQSVNKNVTQIVNQRIAGLEKKYQDRLDKIDSATPNSILQNFLNLYKEAIGYIQFLGNRKNIRTLGDNLKALQSVFTETFNIAKIIRQTIVKIVKQLSSLPTATTGGGGLNLDIDIPGGPLRRGPMSALSRVVRAGKPALMLGGAALAGGLGSKVVSGMMDIGGDVQALPMDQGMIPGVLLDRFNSILDRFSLAINSLSNVKKSQPSPGGAAPVPQKPPGNPPGGATPPPVKGVNAGDITADTPEERAFIATVRESEGTAGSQGYNTFFGGSQYGGDLSTKTVTEVKKIQEKFLAEGRGNWRGGKSAAVGAGQFLYPEQIVREMGMDPNKVKFTPELQNQMILYLAKKKRGIDVSKELSSEDFKVLGKEWAGLSEYYGQGGSLGRTAKLYKENLKEARSGKGLVTTTAKPSAQNPPTVAAAQTQATTQQQLAQSVSKPVAQQSPQVNIVPLNLSAPQTQSTKVGEPIAPPPIMNKGGVTVPFLSSSNHDNFLTLYSKMVYNIVDG